MPYANEINTRAVQKNEKQVSKKAVQTLLVL